MKSQDNNHHATQCREEIQSYLNWAYSKFCKIDEEELPTHRQLMCKIALESKLGRDFSLSEVKNILADKSWQWRTREQIQEVLRQRTVSFSA